MSVPFHLVRPVLLSRVSVERPASKWPGLFEGIPLFVMYPYLLPCGLAALVTFTGELLSTRGLYHFIKSLS